MFDVGSLARMQARPNAQPQASIPVTNLSPEMDGGQSTATGPIISNADEQFILYGGVAVILTAVMLLWFLGAFAFRGLPSV